VSVLLGVAERCEQWSCDEKGASICMRFCVYFYVLLDSKRGDSRVWSTEDEEAV
jgi:hypothetical protein